MRRLMWSGAAVGMLLAVMMAFSARATIAPTPSEAAPVIPSDGFHSPYAARTGSEFISACNADQAGCEGKVADVLISQFSTAAHLCLPGPSYASAIAPWLKAHPETAALAADDAMSK